MDKLEEMVYKVRRFQDPRYLDSIKRTQKGCMNKVVVIPMEEVSVEREEEMTQQHKQIMPTYWKQPWAWEQADEQEPSEVEMDKEVEEIY
jgi:hypothetical protein